MSSADKLVFDLSSEVDAPASVFVRRDWLSILDNQNGSYTSNQCVVDTSQLSNSNKYISYREGSLQIPMLLTITTPVSAGATFSPATSSGDYCLGLRNWFGTIIHSISVEYNGTTVVQQTPFINMWSAFRLMTSLSWDDVVTQGSTIGFYPDDPLSWGYTTASATSGQGTCNNLNLAGNTFSSAVLKNAYNGGLANVGFRRRQSFINYDAAGISLVAAASNAAYSTLLNAESAKLMYKSYVLTAIDAAAAAPGVFQLAVSATVYLKHLHPFFASLPLLKGAYLKLTMALNNTTTVGTKTGGAVMTVASVSNAVGGTNPLMIAAISAGNGSALLNETAGALLNWTASVCVGSKIVESSQSVLGVAAGAVGTGVTLNVPSYTFNPIFEQAYLSSPIKPVIYDDVYSYQVLNIAAQGQINSLITNGIANIKSILVIPYFSSSGASTGVGAGGNIPVYLSPFDDAGGGTTSPLCHLNNFNIVVSGQNALYNTQRYMYEEFNQQLLGQAGQTNGGQTDGLTSGLIDRLGFDSKQCFYYVDLSRMLSAEQSVPKSIQLVGQNMSVHAVDYFCFVTYSVSSLSVDILSGTRV